MARMKIWGPSKSAKGKNKCTIMICPLKKTDEKHTKILSREVIKPLLDYHSTEEGWTVIMKEIPVTLKQENGKFVCPECDKNFVSKSYTKAHIINIHGQGNYPCLVCQEKFKTKPDIKAHQIKYYSESKLDDVGIFKTKALNECIHCKQMFPTTTILEAHMSKNHSEPKAENRGAETFLKPNTGWMENDRNKDKRENMDSIKCNICKNIFHDSKTLYAHMLKKHSEPEAQNRRTEPPPKPKTAGIEGQTKCSLCGILCLTKKQLEIHNETSHTEIKDVSLSCEYCKQKFENARNLVIHKDALHIHDIWFQGTKRDASMVVGNNVEEPNPKKGTNSDILKERSEMMELKIIEKKKTKDKEEQSKDKVEEVKKVKNTQQTQLKYHNLNNYMKNETKPSTVGEIISPPDNLKHSIGVNMVLVNPNSSGNCLFEAVGAVLYGDILYGRQLRREVNNMIAENIAEYKNIGMFASKDDPFERELMIDGKITTIKIESEEDLVTFLRKDISIG